MSWAAEMAANLLQHAEVMDEELQVPCLYSD